MKAVQISEHGSFDKLIIGDAPAPTLRPDEVIIRPQAVALNHLDLWVRRGVPGHKFPLPMIPGCDMAGIVEEVGSLVTNAKVGDRVAIAPGFSDPLSPEAIKGRDHMAFKYGIYGETRNGGCAELVDVSARNLLHMPDDMSFTDAAAFPLTFLTAWGMVVNRAQLRAGEEILIHAAGSGVSVACIQIAKLIGASRIFVTAGSQAKLDKALALGADVGINYKDESFRQVVKEATGKRGVDVIVDHVGPDTMADSISSLTKGGRVVLCGSTTGGSAEVNLRQVFFKSLSILGSTMGPIGDYQELWAHHCAGRLKPVVDRVFPIQEIAQAHEYLETRQAFGKVVLDLANWG